MTLKKKASVAAYGAIYEKAAEVEANVVSEFLSGRHKSQPWEVVPASTLKRVWSSFAREGFVRYEKELDKILAIMVENVSRLMVNNVVSGHTQLPSTIVLENYFGEEDPRIDELQESFVDWAIDIPEGGWRISDYGTDKIVDALALAVEAETSENRLVYMDMALNVCHQRSDLSAWFVEGGRNTLVDISGQGLCT